MMDEKCDQIGTAPENNEKEKSFKIGKPNARQNSGFAATIRGGWHGRGELSEDPWLSVDVHVLEDGKLLPHFSQVSLASFPFRFLFVSDEGKKAGCFFWKTR